MSSPTEQDDISALRRLDRNEWAATYDRYVSSTYAFIAYLLGDQRALAEELHQETWLTAMSAVDQFAPEQGEFRQWLFGIARKRVALHFRRTSARQQKTTFDEDAAENAIADDGDLLPICALEQVERFDAVRAALAELTDDARTVLVSKYVDQLSVADIAARIGKTPKAVESLLSRSRARMRKLLRWYFPHSLGVVE